MKKQILFCQKCNIFTMHDICRKCNSAAVTTKPAKYSAVDKWGEYRREAKKELKSNG